MSKIRMVTNASVLAYADRAAAPLATVHSKVALYVTEGKPAKGPYEKLGFTFD
jgi:hypothetical protein